MCNRAMPWPILQAKPWLLHVIRIIDDIIMSTKPNDSISLVTSVKVSWLRPRTPELRFEYYTCLDTALPRSRTIYEIRYHKKFWLDI